MSGSASGFWTLQNIMDQVTALINRSDMTPALAQTFVLQAIQRIQRSVRLPSMERLLVFNPTVPMTQVGIPKDFIELLGVYTTAEPYYAGYPGGVYIEPNNPATGQPQIVPPGYPSNLPLKSLRRVGYDTLLTINPWSAPVCFARIQAAFQMAGAVMPGATLQLHYYGQFTPFANLNSANELTAASPDLVIYGALSLAADYFVHPSGPAWEGRYQQIHAAVVAQGQDADYGGIMQVGNSHPEAYYW